MITLPIDPNSVAIPYSLVAKAMNKHLPDTAAATTQVSDIQHERQNSFRVEVITWRNGTGFKARYTVTTDRPSEASATFNITEDFSHA